MPGNENTKSGILRGLFICRTSELNPRTKKIAHCTNKSSAQSISKTILKHQNSYCLVSLIRKNFTHPNTHPVILRGAEGEVEESIIQNNPRPSGEGGRRRRG